MRMDTSVLRYQVHKAVRMDFNPWSGQGNSGHMCPIGHI